MLATLIQGVGVKHKREEPPHGELPRCGAKTRSGGVCGHYAMKNGRCRYHGGKSTGARNPHRALKHGRYTKEAVLERKVIAEIIKEAGLLIGDVIERS